MRIKDAKSWLECLDEADFPHEEDVLRNPYSLKSWIRYLDFKSDAPPHVKNVLYERAVRELPGSYKLWHRYLSERRAQVKGTPPFGPHMEAVNTAFERALVYMHKMPRIWVDYCTLLTQQPGKITHTRRTFDRALRALPVTQHDRIWPLYVEWVRKVAIPETTLRVYRRYLKTFPEVAEDYIEYLLSVGYINEAVHKLAKIVNDTHFHSQKGQSKHQLWLKLCELISKYPKQITGLKSEAILREGIRRFTDEVGQLWVALAEYYIRLANFEKARDVFEEGINTVMTVRDFSQIWDAYTRFEDGMIESQMEMQAEAEGEESDIDFDLRIARYENLINQRPLLLSSVVLRQNPHNVHEWHKRAKIFHDNPVERAKVYAEAVRTVDTKKATGKPHSLWVSYAKLYEKGGDLDSARQIFAKAAQVEYRSVDDLASIWCEYAEMELRNQNYKEALKVLEKATVVPRITKVSGDQPVQKRLFKSTKLWSFYADVEESLGTFMSTKAIYDRMIELRIATPQIILNYATFLEENNYFEESFKAYEKGVSLFEFPYVMDLWVAYLTKFVARYGGKKLERIRDLFEQALEGVPPKEAKTLYLMYAHVEEQYGLARHAMSVYDRACRAVVDDDKPFLYTIYLSRATEFFGVTKTREIYDQAIASLPDKYVKDMCLKYADLERKLGEIDRARAVYTHASQYCDPRTEKEFWEVWQKFEVRHGNEDTFREMLRIKRSVQAQYSIQVNVMSAEMMASLANKPPEQRAAAPRDEMAALEAAIGPKKDLGGLPRVGAAPGSTVVFTSAKELVPAVQNPEEISLEDEEEEEEEEEGKGGKAMEIEQKQVPQAVFGSLASGGGEGASSEGGEAMGALARLRQHKSK